MPLIEISDSADMRSPEEAYAYLTALKEVIQSTLNFDVKMEEGSMRVDANISLHMVSSGTQTELKTPTPSQTSCGLNTKSNARLKSSSVVTSPRNTSLR